MLISLNYLTWLVFKQLDAYPEQHYRLGDITRESLYSEIKIA